MGMYCCCDWKMTRSTHIDMVNKTITEYESDPDGCTCDWKDWISVYDWPQERKNKDKPFGLPKNDGKYLVRFQTNDGDRCECEMEFKIQSRKVCCGYTGKEVEVHWSGNDEEQPYAWKEINQTQDTK